MIRPTILKNTAPPYSPSVQNVFANWANGGYTPTEIEKRAAAIFWDSQVESGNARHIHHFCIGRRFSSELGCTVNWVSTNHSTGTGTWNIATGIQTNGTSNFWDTNFIESSMAVNADGSSTLNNIGFAVELTSNDHGTSAGTIFGVVGSAAARQTRYDQSAGGTNRTWKVHTSSTVTEALGVFQSGKWHTLYRSLSNRQGTEYEWDGLTTNGTASSNIPDRKMYVGGLNNNGTAQAFFAGKFGTMIAFNYNQFDYTNFYVNWQFMMQMLGDTKDDLYPYDSVKQYYKNTDAFVVKLNGQSNGSGRATGRLAKYTYPLNSLVMWTTANPPVTGTPTVIQQLEFGKNQTFDNLAESGYELSLCYELSKSINAKVVLDKFTRDGSDLAGVTVDTWKVSDNDLSNLSENLISIRGLQLIDDIYTIKKIYWIWDQHEADRNGTSQATYQLEFSLLLKYMIDQHEAAGYNFANTELHVIIRKIASSLTGSTVADIAAAQIGMESYFNTNYSSYTSKVRSWKLFSSENLQFSDGVHFTPRSYEIIGIRLGMYLSRK